MIPRVPAKPLVASTPLTSFYEARDVIGSFSVGNTNVETHSLIVEEDPGFAWEQGWATSPITALSGTALFRVSEAAYLYAEPVLDFLGVPVGPGTVFRSWAWFWRRAYGSPRYIAPFTAVNAGGDVATVFAWRNLPIAAEVLECDYQIINVNPFLVIDQWRVGWYGGELGRD